MGGCSKQRAHGFPLAESSPGEKRSLSSSVNSAVVTGHESFPCWSPDCLIKASVVFFVELWVSFWDIENVLELDSNDDRIES